MHQNAKSIINANIISMYASIIAIAGPLSAPECKVERKLERSVDAATTLFLELSLFKEFAKVRPLRVMFLACMLALLNLRQLQVPWNVN